MRKINTNTLVEVSGASPKGKYGGFDKQVSEGLGRKPHPQSMRAISLVGWPPTLRIVSISAHVSWREGACPIRAGRTARKPLTS